MSGYKALMETGLAQCGLIITKENNMINLSPYRKTVTAVVTGLIGWASSVVVSNPTAVTAGEWIMLATVLATSFGVYQVANEITRRK